MIKPLLIIAIGITLSACGLSDDEIAAKEQARKDSLARANKEEILTQQAEAEHQESLRHRMNSLKDKLDYYEAKRQRLQTDKTHQNKTEKENSVNQQTQIIEELKSQINDLSKEIKE